MKWLLLCLAAPLLGVSAQDVDSEVTNPERNNSSPTMMVTGLGAVDIYTNLVRIDATVRNSVPCKGKNITDCDVGALQSKMIKTLDKIKNLEDMDGVENIQTQGLGLTTNIKYINGTPVFQGYTSTANVVAIVETSAFGKLLNEMLKNGVKSIDQTQYYVSVEERLEAQKKCLKLAAENAKQQADAILSSLGHSLRDIKTIQIPYNNAPFVDQQVSPGTSVAEGESPVTNGRLTVSYKVKIRVGY